MDSCLLAQHQHALRSLLHTALRALGQERAAPRVLSPCCTRPDDQDTRARAWQVAKLRKEKEASEGGDASSLLKVAEMLGSVGAGGLLSSAMGSANKLLSAHKLDVTSDPVGASRGVAAAVSG